MIRHGERAKFDFRELILRRLALNPELSESSTPIKGLTRYQISIMVDEIDKRIIPQSTILHRTEELEKNGLIRCISKTKLSAGKYRKTYDITALGVISWFHYLNNHREILKSIGLNKIREVITKSTRLFPFISANWLKLNEIFKNETVLTMTLLWTSDIKINHYDNNFAGSLASAPLNVGYLTIQLTNQVYPIIPKELRTNTAFEARDRNTAELFTFVYLYTLNRQQPIENKKLYYENRKKLLSLIKSHPPTYDIYLKFINQLKAEVEMASDYVKGIEVELKN